MNLNLRGFFLIYGPNSVRLDAIAVAVAQGMNISILGDRGLGAAGRELPQI